MSKRALTDQNNTLIASNKRPKKDENQIKDLTLKNLNEENLLDINVLEKFLEKINKCLFGSENQQIKEITNLFEETIKSSLEEATNTDCLFISLIEQLSIRSCELNLKVVSHCSTLLSLQIDSLDIITIKNSINIFLQVIKNKTPFTEEFVSIYIELFKYVQKIPIVESRDITGLVYVELKITEILSYKWIPSSALNIIMLLKNVSMETNQISNLMSKIFDLNEIQFSCGQIPSLINLILSLNQRKKNRSPIIENILKYFCSLTKRMQSDSKIYKNDMFDAEILSILNCINTIKADYSYGREFLRILKNKVNRNLIELVQPFTFALIISLIKVLPSNEVIELLKQIITRVYESELKVKKHIWIFKCLTDEEKRISSFLLKPSKYRLYSNNAILPGFIQFIFELLDTHGIRMVKHLQPTNLKQNVTLYASEMLRDIFRFISVSREDILNKLTERIFSTNICKATIFIDQLTILILSEPANLFQDYFQKFKSRLDHMIFMAPVVAFEFLNAIKPLLKYDSIYKNNLITILKQSIFQSNLDVRKVGLIGLIYLLNSTQLSNFLPSSQASQSMSLSQSQSQTNKTHMSEEKISEKNCLEIFHCLRRCLTQQIEIKSKLYQSCSKLIVLNKTLVGPILNLLLTNFENYIIKTDFEILLNLAKCVKVNSSNKFEIIEPIDILLHSLHLCNKKFKNIYLENETSAFDNDINKHSEIINIYFDKLKTHFLQQNDQYIIDAYKSQLSSVILTSSKDSANVSQDNILKQPANQSNADLLLTMSVFQCLLGSFEVLLEHFFDNGSYKHFMEIFKKINQLHVLIQKQHFGSDNTSKKNSRNQIKTKQNKTDNEITTTNDLNFNKTVHNEQTQEVESTKKALSKINDKKANIEKFNYVHRISYSCILQLLKIYFSIPKNNDEQDNKEIDELSVQLKSDDSFLIYLLKVLTQQLEYFLENNIHSNNESLKIYDCESFNQTEIFNYLSQLWSLFWHELNYYKCPVTECGLHGPYCNECINSKYQYVTIVHYIWKITSNSFNYKLNELLSSSVFEDDKIYNSSYNSNTSSNTSIVAVSILDLCRKFIDRSLSNQIECKSNSFKLAVKIIDLMYDISNLTCLKIFDYSIIFKWTQQIFTNETINDSRLIKSLGSFFILITWNKNSSAALIKYICQDMAHIFGIQQSNENTFDSTEQIFSALNHNNVMPLISIIFDELSNIIGVFEWFITFKSDSHSILSLHKQLYLVLESISWLLIINLPSAYQQILIKTISKCYQFLILFCKSIKERRITDEEAKSFKNIVDFTALKIQKPLNHFIRSVQNAKSIINNDKKGKNSKKKETKDDSSNAKLVKCEKLIPNLVYLIEQYIIDLKTLNKHFENKNDLTENFDVCYRDFKLFLPSAEENTVDEDLDETNLNETS